ncbi:MULTISPECIES: cytochrome c biogenesis protein ResB [unclassified Paludibacterium]|uniref:cytochrome c biogenesis protein ResB n=1 Tax=unclassified Paludibacterium TaxID=2618429 RepID=UPI001C05758C|nr:cytochrome c biogenesis protein ResB [Paludibacterium sp. B53371]BEV72538.1 cytochrome c biogenesis protein ResB [Paludibacterium sp. THUN1379]
MKTDRRTQTSLRALYELLSSMRFAIGLLTILAIASIIGTVLKQNEPYPNYAFEFGQYWFQVFATLGLYDVYHSAWFITILAFLMLSTTLCIIRNAPGFLRDIRSYRTSARERSLAAMKLSAQWAGQADTAALSSYLQRQGFRLRTVEREDGSTLIAAKKGSASRLGYFFAHGAMIIICLGGLIDGNLPLKMRELFGSVVAETRDLPQSQIPAQSRLSTGNLSFRGDVTIAENKSADVVFINSGPGYLVQELPFIVTLRKFNVDYYSNGMPKLFASDIEVTDKASGKITRARVEVNHPLIVDGVAIYQASFGDGGSPLKLKAWNLDSPQSAPVTIDGLSKASQPLRANGRDYRLEFNDLRVFNIEDMSNRSQTDHSLGQRMKDAREVTRERQLKNVGPSIGFKIRDSQGQAHEYLTYMAPIQQDGASYLIAASRSEVSQPFDYLRIPLDDQMSVDTFMRLRAAVMNPALYDEIAAQSGAKAMQGNAISPAMRKEFEASVKWILSRFAEGGFDGLQTFLEQHVPADKRADVAQTYIKILQGAIIDVMDVANRHAGVAPMARDAGHYRFLLDSLVAISAFKDYGAPVFLQLDSFQQVQASGLQMTRSPGKTLVYLGSLLLVIGILLMFYIQERRLWLLIKPDSLLLAMSANRPNPDLDRDFARHQDAIQQLARGEDGHRPTA